MAEISGLQTIPNVVERDLRIDLLRGVSLLMIVIDHIEWTNGIKILSPFTLHGIGLSDAAEVFVFLSGLVCGISYGRVSAESGWWACQRKACRRAGQLYIANLATLVVVLMIVKGSSQADLGSFRALRFEGMDAPVSVFWPRVLLMIYLPSMFDILVLYIVFLLILPTFLLGLSRRPLITFYIALQLYLLAQLYPQLSYPKYIWNAEGFETTTFTQAAWQLLFFTGAILGYLRLKGLTFRIPRQLGLACGALVVMIAIVKLAPTLGYRVPDFAAGLLHAAEHSAFSDKWTLGPIRLVYFTVLTTAVTGFCPSISKRRLNPVLKTVIGCGQNSLSIFCLGIVLSVTAHPVHEWFERSTPALVGYEIASCLCMLLLGGWLYRRKNPGPQAQLPTA